MQSSQDSGRGVAALPMPGNDRGARLRKRGHDARRRRGVVVMVALVAIAIASAVFVSLLRLAAAEQGATRMEARRVQAAWLVESGLERAAARLAADPEYQGETWQIAAEALAGRERAVVRIDVQTVPEQAGRRQVVVRADYPDHPRHRARQSKQLVMEVSPAS
jgi:Tfp pilus assembly protein PilV